MKSQATHNENKQNQSGTAGDAQSVQERAYELFLKRGQEPGHELEDWLQAERDLQQRPQHQKSN